ncbi:MAG TPA: hypothetical protein VF988_05470, partial [Verrucomicrobiae bacterium]
MKFPGSFLLALGFVANVAMGQGAAGSGAANSNADGITGGQLTDTPQITQSGPNSSLWQWQTLETLPDGTTVSHLHQYQEIGSELN